MKKIWVSLLIGAALTVSAGAADVGTIDNGYPGDTEAQAQMLCDLGLFRGTENGFELEKLMTRAEAAAMLTRFLGAEQEALAGDWEHPFTDVPQWAEPYVGWLYESGLTKGVSETVYGAGEDVTCGQYCTFLQRALSDNPLWGQVAAEEEIVACGTAGFLRGDAVSLSARALSADYSKGRTSALEFPSLAYHMIDSGVFTTEQLRDAAWDVLPRSYVRANRYGTQYTGDGKLSCVIAGVRVLLDEDSEVIPDRDWIYETGRLYGWMQTGDDQMMVYRIDGNTLETTELFSGDMMGTSLLCTAGGRDYFLVGRSLLVVEGDAVRQEDITFGSQRGGFAQPYGETGDCFVTACEQGIYVIDAAGGHVIGSQPVSRVDIVDGLIVAQRISAEQTTVAAWTIAGENRGSYTVPNPMPQELHDDLILQAEVNVYEGGYLYGAAGLYRAADGQLAQIAACPVYSFAQDAADGSYVIVTHEPGRLVRADMGGNVINQTGDMLACVDRDGGITPLLPALPEGSLLLGRVESVQDGVVCFTELRQAAPDAMGEFRCMLENGRITVTEALETDMFTWGENAAAEEQARLDSLGIGVHS